MNCVTGLERNASLSNDAGSHDDNPRLVQQQRSRSLGLIRRSLWWRGSIVG